MGGNPLNNIDPLGLAKCIYSIKEHRLVCTSNDGSNSASASNGVSSGLKQCENESSCSDIKDEGPVPPGTYNIFENQKPGREGWWALQSTSWIPNVSGALCISGLSRCGFNIHLGSYSLGCITFNKNNSSAVQNFQNISNILNSDAPNNTLTVYPNSSCTSTRRGLRCKQ